jgi:hypothetical protein
MTYPTPEAIVGLVLSVILAGCFIGTVVWRMRT